MSLLRLCPIDIYLALAASQGISMGAGSDVHHIRGGNPLMGGTLVAVTFSAEVVYEHYPFGVDCTSGDHLQGISVDSGSGVPHVRRGIPRLHGTFLAL